MLLRAGLLITIPRKWCLRVPLRLKHPRHLLSAAVLTACRLLCVSVGPRTPVVLTVFDDPLVLMRARTLLTNSSTLFLSVMILRMMVPSCLLNLFRHPVFVTRVFTLSEQTIPDPRPLGMLLLMTWRVTFLVTVAPFMLVLLIRTGPPPAWCERTRNMCWTLLLWLTIGLSPFEWVRLPRPMVHPFSVLNRRLEARELIAVFPWKTWTVLRSLPLAVLSCPRTLVVRLCLVMRFSRRRLIEVHPLLKPPAKLMVCRTIPEALRVKNRLLLFLICGRELIVCRALLCSLCMPMLMCFSRNAVSELLLWTSIVSRRSGLIVRRLCLCVRPSVVRNVLRVPTANAPTPTTVKPNPIWLDGLCLGL